MIDSRDAAGATDPDPGCTSATDTSENSETEIPEWCESASALLERRQAPTRA